MNLDFEELGKVTIVAMMQGGNFFVSFKTDNSEFRSVLNSNLQELQQMFQEQGLNLKTADVLGMEENHLMPFERLESFENIINIRI
jgi:flagellar hook-length control protein FliK